MGRETTDHSHPTKGRRQRIRGYGWAIETQRDTTLSDKPAQPPRSIQDREIAAMVSLRALTKPEGEQDERIHDD